MFKKNERPLIVNKMQKTPKGKKEDNKVTKIGVSARHKTKKFMLYPCYKPISLLSE